MRHGLIQLILLLDIVNLLLGYAVMRHAVLCCAVTSCSGQSPLTIADSSLFKGNYQFNCQTAALGDICNGTCTEINSAAQILWVKANGNTGWTYLSGDCTPPPAGESILFQQGAFA